MSKETLITSEPKIVEQNHNGHSFPISEVTLPLKPEISFEPQPYEIIEKDGGCYIRFYGEISSGMKLFYEREASYKRKMKEQKEMWEKGVDINQCNISSPPHEIEVNLDGEIAILEPNSALDLFPRRAIPSQ